MTGQRGLAALAAGRVSLFWLLAFGSLQLHGQATFSTIMANGPVSNRVNVVFLSEGYTSGQLGQFLAEATNAANALLANPPFAEYRNYFNVFAISVASAESGSDHPTSAIQRNTYFNSSYDALADYLISIPPNEFDANYNNGQGKVDALLNTHMPACNLAALLVNDPGIGGSDGGGQLAIASVSSTLSDILVHESGHVLANLGDEYTTPYPGYPDTEEPNTTRETNRAAIKWNAWIATNTPVPTPVTAPYFSVVGLFEGAHYHSTGWYRPMINCRMRDSTSPFCDICREALVLSIYRQVRPIDSFSPVTTNLSATSPQALNFAVTLLQPVDHALSLQWLTNGVPLPGATNSALNLLPTALGNGTNTVASRVVDPTGLVRTDTSNLLSQTLTWTVTVNVPQLQLSAPRWLGDGRFAFRIAGNAPQGFAIQISTNATAWTPVATNNLINGQFDYTNQSAGGFPLRMFRAVTPP